MLLSNQGDIKNVALEPGQHQICNPLDSFDLKCESVTFSICNMGTSGLLDMYTPKHEGRRAEGVHIRYTMSAHVTNAM